MKNTVKDAIGFVIPPNLFVKLEDFRKRFSPKMNRSEALRSILEEFFEIQEEIEEMDNGYTFIRSQTTGEALKLPEDIASEWISDPEFVQCSKHYYINHST